MSCLQEKTTPALSGMTEGFSAGVKETLVNSALAIQTTRVRLSSPTRSGPVAKQSTSVLEANTPVLCSITVQSCVGDVTITARSVMEVREVSEIHQPTPLACLAQRLQLKWAWISRVHCSTTALLCAGVVDLVAVLAMEEQAILHSRSTPIRCLEEGRLSLLTSAITTLAPFLMTGMLHAGDREAEVASEQAIRTADPRQHLRITSAQPTKRLMLLLDDTQVVH